MFENDLCPIIPRHLHGQRIDRVLAELLPAFSRAKLSQWLKEGKITINGRLFKPKDKVLGGESIQFIGSLESSSPSNEDNEPEAIPLSIVYEDEALIVIDKPAGLVVHPGAGNAKHTLVNALLHHAPLQHLPRAGIVHRLDKDTTGLLLIAKTLKSHTALVRQMQQRAIHRRYLALVYGHVIAGGVIDTYFGRHPRNRLKMAVCQQGRQAITHYSIKTHYSAYTLLDVELLTGRTHQIRVHMAHINHPIVGDPLYGGRLRYPKDASEDLRFILEGFKRQALHARKLSFIHPETNKQLSLEAPLPSDFQTLLNALDKHFD